MSVRSGKLPFLGSEDEFFYHTGLNDEVTAVKFLLMSPLRHRIEFSARGFIMLFDKKAPMNQSFSCAKK